jgi:hypothetical protein
MGNSFIENYKFANCCYKKEKEIFIKSKTLKMENLHDLYDNNNINNIIETQDNNTNKNQIKKDQKEIISVNNQTLLTNNNQNISSKNNNLNINNNSNICNFNNTHYDEIHNNNNNNNSLILLKPQISPRRNNLESSKNLLNKSSLKEIRSVNSNQGYHSDNNNNNNSKSNGKIFTDSILNEDCPEEFNINENKYNYFFLKIYEEINKSRCDFLYYSKLIMKYSNEIKVGKNNRNYFVSNDKKIFFEYEKKDFLECAKYFENLDQVFNKKKNTLKKLDYIEEIQFPLPKTEFESIFERNYIAENFLILRKKFKEKYLISKILFFKCTTKEPEISIIIELINEIKGKSKKILLNDELKYLNINFKVLNDGMIGVFLVFAK